MPRSAGKLCQRKWAACCHIFLLLSGTGVLHNICAEHHTPPSSLKAEDEVTWQAVALCQSLPKSCISHGLSGNMMTPHSCRSCAGIVSAAPPWSKALQDSSSQQQILPQALRSDAVQEWHASALEPSLSLTAPAEGNSSPRPGKAPQTTWQWLESLWPFGRNISRRPGYRWVLACSASACICCPWLEWHTTQECWD